MKFYVLLIAYLLIGKIVFSQSIYKVDTKTKTLEANFKNTFDKAEFPVLIGYSINADEDKLITMGSFVVKKRSNAISLREMIEGKSFPSSSNFDNEYYNINAPIIVIGRSDNEEITPDKETAVIFYYDKNSNNITEPSRTYILNMSSMVKLKNIPLYWLGNQGIEESLDLLFDQYKTANNSDTKEDFLAPIAVHKISEATTPFLIDIVTNEKDDELREAAVFWLAYQDNIEAFNTLKNIAYSESEDEDLREEAVMGLAQLTIQAGFQEVAKIAKSCNEKFLREEAIMWLGQFAVKKAKDQLKDIVENDPEIDLKKHALYALSESDDDMVPYFIDIANNSNSIKLKKTAIYILGEYEDERAVDALIKLATK